MLFAKKNVKNIDNATSFIWLKVSQFIKSHNKRVLGNYIYLLYNNKLKLYIKLLY